MGLTWSLDAGMGGLHTGPCLPQNGADPESYFDHHMVHPRYQPTDRATAGMWHSMARLTLLVSLGRLTTLLRGTPIINPRAEEACQPCLATHLGEGNLISSLLSEDIAGTVPAS